MIDLALPALFLSFDDWWEKEWAAYIPTMVEHNVKATFYSCPKRGIPMRRIDTDEDAVAVIKLAYWQALRALAGAGHTIGFHTVNHMKMDGEVRARGMDEAIQFEIVRGLKMFADAGLTPRHFAYPYGNHQALLDFHLLHYFSTLRTIVPPNAPNTMRFYTPQNLMRERVIVAHDLKYDGCFDAVKKTIADKRIGFFFAHKPADYIAELAELFRLGTEGGATFYPMSALEE